MEQHNFEARLFFICMLFVIGMGVSFILYNQRVYHEEDKANQDTIKREIRLHNSLHVDNVGTIYFPKKDTIKNK